MKLYIARNDRAGEKSVVLDDMILTKDMPTTAGSKMLDGYMSPLEAETVVRLRDAGYDIAGKANVGEFAIDLMGETSYAGACVKEDGTLADASAEIVRSGEAVAAVVLDVNGSPRRAAAQNGMIYMKPTYGAVSRYGTVPVACSGETVGVMASTAADCRQVLSAITGYDCKDGTSIPENMAAELRAAAEACGIKKAAVARSMTASADAETRDAVSRVCGILAKAGIEIAEVDDEILASARTAWNILMSAELCNNVSRYDGVKYGYRTKDYSTIGELYTGSRTEAFGDLLKTAILYGSDTLSTENYMNVYDKALRIRRVISEYFGGLFGGGYDAVILPACLSGAYDAEAVKADKYISFKENICTAPASITGLPTLVAGGVQIIGRAFSEKCLFDAAELIEKEGV